MTALIILAAYTQLKKLAFLRLAMRHGAKKFDVTFSRFQGEFSPVFQQQTKFLWNGVDRERKNKVIRFHRVFRLWCRDWFQDFRTVLFSTLKHKTPLCFGPKIVSKVPSYFFRLLLDVIYWASFPAAKPSRRLESCRSLVGSHIKRYFRTGEAEVEKNGGKNSEW